MTDENQKDRPDSESSKNWRLFARCKSPEAVEIVAAQSANSEQIEQAMKLPLLKGWSKEAMLTQIQSVPPKVLAKLIADDVAAITHQPPPYRFIDGAFGWEANQQTVKALEKKNRQLQGQD